MLTKVVKVTRAQFEELLKHGHVTIEGQSVPYDDKYVYVIKEEKGLQYEDL